MNDGRIGYFYNEGTVSGGTSALIFKYTDDNFETQSSRMVITTPSLVGMAAATGKGISIGDTSIIELSANNIIYSLETYDNGLSWAINDVIANGNTLGLALSETALIRLPDCTLVALIRAGDRDGAFYQSIKRFGGSWTSPVRTNLPPYFNIAPNLILDQNTNSILLFGSARLSQQFNSFNSLGHPYLSTQDYKFIYKANVDNIVNPSFYWEMVDSSSRPTTGQVSIYGYQSVVKLAPDEYYVFINDQQYNEDWVINSSLYSYRLFYNPSPSIPCFSNEREIDQYIGTNGVGIKIAGGLLLERSGDYGIKMVDHHNQTVFVNLNPYTGHSFIRKNVSIGTAREFSNIGNIIGVESSGLAVLSVADYTTNRGVEFISDGGDMVIQGKADLTTSPINYNLSLNKFGGTLKMPSGTTITSGSFDLGTSSSNILKVKSTFTLGSGRAVPSGYGGMINNETGATKTLLMADVSVNRAVEFFGSGGSFAIQGMADVFSTPINYNLSLNPLGGDVGIGNNSPTAKLEVSNGDIKVSDVGNGVIVASPDGSLWRLTPDNSGNSVWTLIP